MDNPFHLLVWIDHHTARLFAITRDTIRELRTITSRDTGRGNVHHHAGTPGAGHLPLATTFLQEVTGALTDAEEILITGPGAARFELKAHLASHAPAIDGRVLGVEPMDDAGTDRLRAFARTFFHRKDLMQKPGVRNP